MTTSTPIRVRVTREYEVNPEQWAAEYDMDASTTTLDDIRVDIENYLGDREVADADWADWADGDGTVTQTRHTVLVGEGPCAAVTAVAVPDESGPQVQSDPVFQVVELTADQAAGLAAELLAGRGGRVRIGIEEGVVKVDAGYGWTVGWERLT